MACLILSMRSSGRSPEIGGLNAPQAAGFIVLYYDYEHLATRNQTQ